MRNSELEYGTSSLDSVFRIKYFNLNIEEIDDLQIKDILEKAILDAANAIIEDGIFKLAESDKLPDVLLEVPPKKEFGDFATNFAMQSAKIFHSNPRKIAEEIKNRIKLDQIEKIEIAGAGFLNFYLKSTVIYDNFRQIFNAGDNYGQLPNKNNKTNSFSINLSIISPTVYFCALRLGKFIFSRISVSVLFAHSFASVLSLNVFVTGL